jgi:hypothetical protein
VFGIEVLDLEQVCWHRSCHYFGERTPCKKLADLHPGQGNVGTTKEQFYMAQQNLPLLHKIGWRPAEKSPFFQHASSKSKIAMVLGPLIYLSFSTHEQRILSQ